MCSTDMFWKVLLAALVLTSSVFTIEVVGDPFNMPEEKNVFDDWSLAAERSTDCVDGSYTCHMMQERCYPSVLSLCPKTCGKCGDAYVDEVTCPPDFTLEDNQCLNYNKGDKKTWNEAFEDCKGKKSELYIPANRNQINEVPKYDDFNSYWLGASYNATEGKWLWLDGVPLQSKQIKKMYSKYDRCPFYHLGFASIKCNLLGRYICIAKDSAQVQPKTTIPVQLTTTPAATTIKPKVITESTTQSKPTTIKKTTTPDVTCEKITDTTKTTTSLLFSTTQIPMTSSPQATTTIASPKTPDIFGQGGIVVDPCSFSTGQKYWPHPTNCHRYIHCTNGVYKEMLCPKGTAWSTTMFFCIHEANTDCRQGVTPALPEKEDQFCQCGVANRERIIGGDNVTLARKYPWQVDLKVQMLHTDIHVQRCGGTIINDRWILTAAHCIFTKELVQNQTIMLYSNSKVPVTAHNQTIMLAPKSIFTITVAVGDHIRNYVGDDDVEITKDYKIKQCIPHPNYDLDVQNDFALLEITDAIPFGTGIMPICLPDGNSKDYAGETGTAIGWGSTSNEDGSGSDILKELQVSILGNDNCGEWNKALHLTVLPSYTMCADGDSSGSNVCSGDSGGPLMVFDKNRSRYVQVGIASFVKNINETHIDCDNPDYPGVYARVTEVLKWITDTTSNGKKCN